MNEFRFPNFVENGIRYVYVEPEVMYAVITDVEADETYMTTNGDHSWLKTDLTRVFNVYRTYLSCIMHEPHENPATVEFRSTSLNELERMALGGILLITPEITETQKFRYEAAMQVIREQVASLCLTQIVN